MARVGMLSVVLGCLSLLSGASAYPIYGDRLPNGDAVPHPCKPNYMWKGVGHTNPLGSGDRNKFGKDFRAAGSTWTPDLCRMDSDGDGVTNGQELGDPDCVWKEGSLPNRTTSITHPGVCTPWTDPKCSQKNTWVNCDVESLKCDVLQNDSDVRNVTMRFPSTQVPNKETTYICMTFDLPADDTYHLVATEPYIDNAQVMHHILVFGCADSNSQPNLTKPTECGMEVSPDCNMLIALWQVGMAGTCINPNAGFSFGKGQRFTRIKMQLHWNNPELRADYRDSSGMHFFYTPNLRPNSAATLIVGQNFLDIPPLQPLVQAVGSCTSDCTRAIASGPFYVIQVVNHMHYLGRKQKVEVFRNNSLVATLSNDEAYSYDAPVIHIHNPAVAVQPGDEIRTTCDFSSKNKATATKYGEATSDEMCFGFLTFYPSEALSRTTCVALKQYTFCEKECDFTRFLNQSFPEQRELVHNLTTHCQPFGPCTPECERVLAPLKNEPCMKWNAFEIIKYTGMQTPEGMRLLAHLTACRPTLPCPTCPKCPINNGSSSSNNNNSNNNDGDTGGVSALAPALVSVAAVVMLSFFHN